MPRAVPVRHVYRVYTPRRTPLGRRRNRCVSGVNAAAVLNRPILVASTKRAWCVHRCTPSIVYERQAGPRRRGWVRVK